MNKKSKALTDVWEWKAAAYKEVADLKLADAIDTRLRNSIATTAALGFHTASINVSEIKLSV